ncbi:hypothetical protein [Nocardia sp. NPDC050717]|uniref:hypothetical protein n=1 Tax=Nocardia sp. NPDC050717 TaxID=3157221 RepID=UPI0034106EB7
MSTFGAGAQLWRRRLFEAEAGLTKFVVDSQGGKHLDRLIEVKHEIYGAIPQSGPAAESEWKSAFFRAQAAMERFVVRNFGHEKLGAWAETNGTIYGAIDDEGRNDAVTPLRRLESQAALYGSKMRWLSASAADATLEIAHCAIWDYREQARARGVTITLEAPCEYCVPATTSLINAKGLRAECTLSEQPGGARGCIWNASR